MPAHAVVMPAPASDDDLRLTKGVDDLPVQQLVSELACATRPTRTASATVCPCESSTSSWRSLETISSGLSLFRDIGRLPRVKSRTSGRDHYFRGGELVPPRRAPSGWPVRGPGEQSTPPRAEDL